ncbi:MAG TPA: ATP-dependent helicase HrpB [Chitinivibrionales bacterium]|nr:ATP-dependent helicase HrpB [Chitinivibrionales bacterium]
MVNGPPTSMTPLPIIELNDKILSAVQNGNRLIIRAPTGSGKSTQVPQMLLDSGICSGQILVLQPRRLAARMLAARVAEERGTALGNEIGFQTRFESAVSKDTRVRFITEGILPRMFLSDRNLSEVSAVIFDEFHERSLTTDVGLGLVADLQKKTRSDLRIIVMSATLDSAPLKDYLQGSAVIESAGRTFPIALRYASSHASQKPPVWKIAAAATANLVIKEKGDILIFMPGAYEIRRTVEAVSQTVRSESVTVLPLYGDLPANRQHQVMENAGRRKIIVATNIAETSLTIPGVRHVIDSGLARVNRYDSGRGFNTLFTEPISMDSADQRAGRAGREDAGVCVRLWSETEHAGRGRRTTPEVLRVDLAETVLHLRMMGYPSPDEFPWFEKPPVLAIAAANELLALLGALDASGKITDTGKEMSEFPMHPRLARLLIEAGKRGAARLASFGAALLSERSALAGKPEYPEETHRHELASDFYGQYCLLEKISKSGFDPAMCARNAVNAGAARNILRTQALFLQLCRQKGLHTRDSQDAPIALAQSLLLAYPDHLAVRKDKGTLNCRLRNNRHGELERNSLARSAEILIAAEIREIKDPKQKLRTMLSLATEIKKEWLREYFVDDWRSESGVEWNTIEQAVESRGSTWCLGVLIEEKKYINVDLEKASSLLADIIIEKNMPLKGWDQAASDFINRVRWASEQFPDEKLPSFTEDDRRLVVHAMCEGERRYAIVRDKPALPFLHESLNCRQHRFLDSAAPPYVELPNGRRMRIQYEPGKQPRGRTRIQDLYGMRSTPRVGNNRVPLLIEILAPNNRPVQITEDLESFWKIHYPELKKTLSRRYPKHEWR